MSVIADFSIPADNFPLGHLLEVRQGVQVRLESMIPTGSTAVPYFWVQSPDVEAVEEALRESAVVETVTVVDEIEDETLFRVDWDEDIDGVVEAIADAEAMILEARGHGDHWSFQIRFHEYETMSRFYRDLVDKDISVELEGVNNQSPSSRSADFGITPGQHEALQLALRRGYFSVPRETTLVDLAEELGISDSAVSQRIRRGLTNVLSTTLARDLESR